MNGNDLRKAIADARKARYENGTSGEATFVSGDVAAGKLRKPPAEVEAEVEAESDDDNDGC